MTNPKKDEQKEKLSERPSASDRKESLIEQSKKLKEERSDKESKELGIKKTTPKETADIKREILEEEVVGADKETPKFILGLDPDKEVLLQAENYKRLALVGNTLLPKLFAKNVLKKDLSDFSKLSTFKLPKNTPLNSSEAAALKKIKEISSKPKSKAYKFFNSKPDFLTFRYLSEYLDESDKNLTLWNALLNKSHKSYKEALTAKNAVNAPSKHKETKEEKSNWIVQTIKKHPLATALVIAAGAYGIYRIFFKEDTALPDSTTKTKKPGEKETFWEKIGLTSKKRKIAAIIVGLLVLGGLLGKGEIGEFISKIINKPIEKIKEVLALLNLGKVKEAWNAITDIDKHKETAIEAGKKSYEWLDKKLNFTGAYKELTGFFKEHNLEVPESLKGLSFSSVAATLGIDPENESTWKEFMVGGGVMGSALLLYKYTKMKSIPISAGLYVFFIRKGSDSLGAKLLRPVERQIDKAKTVIMDKLKASLGENSIIAEYILSEAFYNFKLEDSTDDILNWAKEHPAESLVAINGLWICRSIIYKFIVGGGLLAGKGALYTVKNPDKAALFLAGGLLAGGMIYTMRKKIVADIVDALYENPNSKEAKETLKMLDEKLEIDREAPDTMEEKKLPAYINSIILDPLNRLKDPEIIEAFKKGEFLIGFSLATGRVLLFTAEMTAPVVLSRLTYESFMTSLAHIYSPESEGNRMKAMAIAGIELYVFGSMAIEGMKAYKTLWTSGDYLTDSFMRSLRTLNPTSVEAKFVWRSTFSALPGAKSVLNGLRYFKVRNVQNTLDEILRLAKQPDPDFKEIRRLSAGLETHKIFKDFQAVKANLSGTHHSYRISQRLEDINRRVNDINRYAVDEDKQKVIKHAEDAHANLMVIKRDAGRLLKRFRLIREGKFKEAWSMPDAAEDIKLAAQDAERAKAMRPMTETERIFKNADGTFKKRKDLESAARKLREEIKKLKKNDPLRIAKKKELTAIRAYLDPSRIAKLTIDDAKIAAAPEKLKDGVRAKEVEKLARRLEATEVGFHAKFNAKVQKIISEANAKNIPLSSPEVTLKLQKIDQDMLIPFAQQKQQALNTLSKEFKALPSKLKTKALQRHIANATENTVLTRVIKGAKGRMKLMVLMGALIFASDQIIHKEKADREVDQIIADMGPEMGQLFLDVLPIAGTYSNFHSAFTGREIVTERDVSSTWDRASNVCWGTVGLAGDIITVITAIPSASGAIWANVGVRLGKATVAGSKTAPKLLKMLPRIQKIAERSGGIYKFAQRLTKHLKADGSVLKSLRAVRTIGMVGGTALLAGGAAYHLRYAFVDRETTLDLPKDVQNITSIPSATTAASPEPTKKAA